MNHCLKKRYRRHRNVGRAGDTGLALIEDTPTSADAPPVPEIATPIEPQPNHTPTPVRDAPLPPLAPPPTSAMTENTQVFPQEIYCIQLIRTSYYLLEYSNHVGSN